MEVKIGVIDSRVSSSSTANRPLTRSRHWSRLSSVAASRFWLSSTTRAASSWCRLLVWRTWRSVRPISARSDSRLPSDA